MNVVSKAVSSGALPAGDPLAELLGDLPLWTPEVKKDKPEEPALDDEFLSIPLSPPSPGSAASKLNKAKKISPDATPKLSPGAEDSSAGTQTPSSLPEKSDFSGNLPPKKRAS